MLREPRAAFTPIQKAFPASDPPGWAPSAVAARNHRSARRREEGAIGWAMLWLLGIPVPLLLALFFLRGCT